MGMDLLESAGVCHPDRASFSEILVPVPCGATICDSQRHPDGFFVRRPGNDVPEKSPGSLDTGLDAARLSIHQLLCPIRSAVPVSDLLGHVLAGGVRDDGNSGMAAKRS